MVESVIMLLIYIALVVGLAFLVIWVLQYLGVPLPPIVIRVMWVIAVLVILLLLWRTVGPSLTGFSRLPPGSR